MKFDELGYNKSERNIIFEKIWNVINDDYEIKPSPLKPEFGNVIVLPDDVYWQCDTIVKINDPYKALFKQKWSYYRPSIFATKNNIVKTGCLIYNSTWYKKMSSGESKVINNLKDKIKNNQCTVEEVSEYNWKNINLYKRGIWGIKTLGGKLLGLYLSLDKDFEEEWEKEQKECSLICYENRTNQGLKYEKILTVAELVEKDNNLNKNDIKNIYLGLCLVLKPEDYIKRRISGKVTFDFGSANFGEEE